MEKVTVMDKLTKLLQDKITESSHDYLIKEDLITRISVTTEVIDLLDMDDYSTLEERLPLIGIQMQTLLDPDQYEKLYRQLVGDAHALYSYIKKDEDLFTEEIKRKKSSVKKLKNVFVEQLAQMKAQYKKYSTCSKDKLIQYKNILKSFEYCCPITDVEYELLTKEIIEGNFGMSEQIEIFEKLRVFHMTIDENANIDDSIFAMLKEGYEELRSDAPTDQNEKKRDDSIIDSYLQTFKDAKKHEESLRLLFNEINLENGKCSLDNFKYIYNSMLNNIQFEILRSGRFYNDKNFYLDKELKEECQKDFSINLDLYAKIREFSLSQIANYENSEYDEMLEGKSVAVNELLFAYPGEVNEDQFCHLERDLKKMPEETLDTVRELLYQLKTGVPHSYSEKLTQSNLLKGYCRLKDGQVRLVYKHLNDNVYLIKGVGIKKDQTGTKFYTALAARSDGKKVDEPTKKSVHEGAEKRVIEYIKANSRKKQRN